MPILAEQRSSDARLGYSLLRATLGINIFLHGLSRILAGPATFAGALIPMFRQTLLPSGLVFTYGLSLPWIEAILGLLLCLGLWTRQALVLGSLLILSLTFGATLRQDWESAGLQLIYAAVYAALLAFLAYNRYSLDELHRQRTGAANEA